MGHGVVCMPFGYNHPVRVAERAATLDTLSGGRVDLGGGRGATVREMSLLGVDPDDTYPQLEAALRFIGRAWTGDDPDVLPRPVQRPHPPLFIACTRRDTVTLAAEWGVGALVMGFAGPEEVALLRKAYDDAWDARTGDAGVSTVTNHHLAALCPTITLDDADAAVQIGARGQRFFAESIGHWYAGGPPPSEAVDRTSDAVRDAAAARDAYVAHLHEAAIPVGPHSTTTFDVDQAYGGPDAAIARVERLAAAGADEVMCLMQMGTVPQEACLETIRLWGEHVIPRFR